MNQSKFTAIGKLAAFCGAFALLMAGLAMDGIASQPDQPTPTEITGQPAFEELDLDRNGQITKVEAEDSWLAAAFTRVDANEDGMVNRKEYDSAIAG